MVILRQLIQVLTYLHQIYRQLIIKRILVLGQSRKYPAYRHRRHKLRKCKREGQTQWSRIKE